MLKQQQNLNTGRFALLSTVALLVLATLAISANAAEESKKPSARVFDGATETLKDWQKSGRHESGGHGPKGEVAKTDKTASTDGQVTRVRDADPLRPTTREERQVKLSEFPEDSQERLKKVDREIVRLLELSDEEFRAAAYAYAKTQNTGLRLNSDQAAAFADRVSKMSKNKRARYLAAHRFSYNYSFYKRERQGLGLNHEEAMKIADINADKEDIAFTIEIHRMSRSYAIGKYSDKAKESRGLEMDSRRATKFADTVTLVKEPLKSLKAYQDAYHHAFVHGQGKGGKYMNSAEARKYAEKISGIVGYTDEE